MLLMTTKKTKQNSPLTKKTTLLKPNKKGHHKNNYTLLSDPSWK